MKRAFFLCLPLLAAACGSSDDNTLPTFVKGTIAKTTYDGTTNDLLTGGLGKTGLASPFSRRRETRIVIREVGRSPQAAVRASVTTAVPGRAAGPPNR